jgi:hypothetical protein
MAGVGTTMAMTGLAMGLKNLDGLFDPGSGNKYNSTVADVLGYTGLAIVVASIPLYISSSKNKRKAMSITFKNQLIPQIQKESFVNVPVPSLTLKISL